MLDYIKVTGKDGTVYQSALTDPLTTTIGHYKNTKALDKALKSMAKGERAEFRVKSEYAYGAKGDAELNIPPNTDLLFEIEVVSFEKVKVVFRLVL